MLYCVGIFVQSLMILFICTCMRRLSIMGGNTCITSDSVYKTALLLTNVNLLDDVLKHQYLMTKNQFTQLVCTCFVSTCDSYESIPGKIIPLPTDCASVPCYLMLCVCMCECKFVFYILSMCWNIDITLFLYEQTVYHSVNLEHATQLLENASVLLAILEQTAV